MSSSALRTPENGILLRACGIQKVYLSPLAPFDRFVTALFNRPVRGKSYGVLKGIDLDITRGETLGIIGRNGAGKSTLLGILAGVLPATGGKVVRFGKISVLLELGSGFDQNLTGRENARVYCKLMGMSNREIEVKLPLIAKFADIGEYFDLPARTYSSGMYARVAFASAIHVDAELIIIDETLSVGDASFRVKCYRAIESLQSQGKTFVMVSHNQNVIANFCTRAIVIERGVKVFDGNPLEAVNLYKRIRQEAEAQAAQTSGANADTLENIAVSDDELLNRDLKITDLSFSFEDGPSGQDYCVVVCTIAAERDIKRPVFNLMVRNGTGLLIGALETEEGETGIGSLKKGAIRTIRTRFRNVMAPGAHFISVGAWNIMEGTREPLMLYNECHRFDIVRSGTVQGLVDLNFTWTLVPSDPS